MRWTDLEPTVAFLGVLDAVADHAGQEGHISKRVWGKAFADGCAVMFANALRRRRAFKRRYQIRPHRDGTGTEALTGVGGSEGKKVDVLVSSLASGLQVAISLKAENFPSSKGKFGKNLLNRLYEFSDETRSIHMYQPRAVVVGVFFLPLAACWDRLERSSFHRATDILRARTNRNDRSNPTELYKGDLGYVGLYAANDVTLPSGEIVRRGVLRFSASNLAAPRVGRPAVENTLTLMDVVERIEAYYKAGSEQPLEDGRPEHDPPASPG